MSGQELYSLGMVETDWQLHEPAVLDSFGEWAREADPSKA